MLSAQLLIVHSNTSKAGDHFTPLVSEEGEEILNSTDKKHQTTLFLEHVLY